MQRAADLQRAQAALSSARQQVAVLQTAEAEAQVGIAACRRGRAAGAPEPELHHHHGAGGRHGRRAHAARRPVCAGRHPVDGGGAAARGLCHGELQGDAAYRRAAGPAGRRSRSTCSPAPSVHGVVDSIAPASGQEFALLPPDNATGNFTKIVQRIPVKIVLDRDDPLAGHAAPGHVGRADDRHATTPSTRRGDDAMATDISAADEPPDRLQDLDRGRRRDDRRLHGGAEHPDHQRLAAGYRGRHRHRRRRRRLDLHRLSDRRDHRHPADRTS